MKPYTYWSVTAIRPVLHWLISDCHGVGVAIKTRWFMPLYCPVLAYCNTYLGNSMHLTSYFILMFQTLVCVFSWHTQCPAAEGGGSDYQQVRIASGWLKATETVLQWINNPRRCSVSNSSLFIYLTKSLKDTAVQGCITKHLKETTLKPTWTAQCDVPEAFN